MSTSTMKAVIIRGKKASVELSQPVPKLRPDYLLVKPHAVALNPTDWKHIAGDRAARPWATSGCDFAGTVAEIGPEVTKSWKKGDRIAGVAHGANFSNNQDGVFAEYAVVKGDVQLHIPDSLSFEAASTLPLGAMTVGQGLYKGGLGLNLPTNPITHKEYVLIYGGSTATGSLAVQYAILSGYKVISTASKHNHDFVRSLGAEEVFDYNSPTCGKDINAYTNNKLRYIFDCISLESSAKIGAEALSSDPAEVGSLHYGTVLPLKLSRDDVKVTPRLMYTMFNEAFEFGGREIPASKEDFEFAKEFMQLTEDLLKDGKIKTHPERVGKGGLQGVLEGMKEMQEGKVSGVKLVYLVGETTGEEKTMDYS